MAFSSIKHLTNDYAYAYNVIGDKGIEKENGWGNLILKIGGKCMRMTDETGQMLIKKITEIFEGLPEYNVKVHCNTSISIEGNIILNFDDPIKRELIGLFKKQYISTID